MTSQIPAPSPIVILAAIDGTDASADVLRTSAVLAQTLPGSVLHLVHVVEPAPIEAGVLADVEDALRVAKELVADAAGRARESFTGAIEAHLSAGVPAREILDLASELNADLIVVGPRRKSLAQRLGLGSVSEQIARKASCAVLVARPKSYAPVAAVEPPCADCVAIQSAKGRGDVWCSHHDRSSRHPRARIHYELPAAFARGSLLLRSEE